MDETTGTREHPKFRADLVVSEINQGGETSYVVKDPVTRRFFRFKQHEGFIARQMDGATTPAEIRRRFQERFSVALPEETLDRFIQRIADLSLLDRGLDARQIARAQREASTEHRLANRVLSARLRAIDPDRILTALVPYTRFFFTRAFLVAAGALTAVAVAVTASRWSVYTVEARTLFRPAAIPTFVLVAMVVTVLHEFAHGLTCKHYGGEVHEMGFLLIYFLPAFFCNVSDAWLFASRARRLWVSAAGTIFQVVLYAIAAIAWAWFPPGTWLREACAMAIAIAGLTALFNFNPLIKLDGYYLLSDYLAIPNLRKRAFAYIGDLVRRAFGPPGQQPRELSTREKRIYLVYGIAAGAYSAGLVLFVVVKVVEFVVSAVT